jgi:cytochrome P450
MTRATSDLLDGRDLVAEFETDMGAHLADPHPVYDELRAVHPVHQGDLLTERLGLASSTLSVWEGQPYTILGYEAAEHELRDAEHFSNTVYARTVGKTHGRNILNIDDPDHLYHRKVIQKAFNRKAMDRWRVEYMEPEVQRVIDGLIGRGQCELMSDFALRFPVSVVHHILGLPPEELDYLHNLAAGLLLYRTKPDVAMLCSEELGKLLSEYIDERRRSGANDFIGTLITSRMDNGSCFSDEEIVSFLRILLPAGGETTARTIGSMFAYLTARPELLAEVRADRELIRPVIEETLRLEPPTQYVYRLCVQETQVAGTTIPAGSPIAVSLSAANRDPTAFDDPASFRLGRTTPHLAFGHGVHLCLGMHLARMEASTALTGFLDRVPRLRRDESKPPPVITGIAFRSPATVHLRWDDDKAYPPTHSLETR